MITTKPGDATRFAKEAALSGIDSIVVVGGDGTLNEVVNGLINEDGSVIAPNLSIGLLSTGRGCDFGKSLLVPNDIRKGVDALVLPDIQNIDLGRATFKDDFGRQRTRYFLNVSSVGLAANVVKDINVLPPYWPASLKYFVAGARRFLTSPPFGVRLVIDDKEVFSGNALNIFVANGKYCGGGMNFAPDAKPGDGEFDVVVLGNIPKFKIVTSAHKLYDGSILGLKGVQLFRGKRIQVETTEKIDVEMDGEQPGQSPVSYDLLPSALKFVSGNS